MMRRINERPVNFTLDVNVAIREFAALFFFGMTLYSPAIYAQTRVGIVKDGDNIRPKIYQRTEKLELAVPSFGMILNQGFVRTYLIHAGLTYYPEEHIGYGIEGAFGLNSDKEERTCLETFLNDNDSRARAVCGSKGGDVDIDNSTINYGPAYMPIREIQMLLAGNFNWNPVYGKQLMFLSNTTYFDLFLTVGLGLAFSDFYPKSTLLKDGRPSRAPRQTDQVGSPLEPGKGASSTETQLIGVEGRPLVESSTLPYLNLGLGQRYHFGKQFSVRFEFRSMTIFGTPSGFDNLFAILVGTGVRF